MDSEVVHLHSATQQVVDVTDAVEQFCAGRGDGLCSVFLPHATAGLALMETGSGSESDLLDALARVLPRPGGYRHRHGTPGHGADHVLPVLVSPSLVLPVVDGHVTLGTWQRVVVVDTNVDNPRRNLRLSFVPA